MAFSFCTVKVLLVTVIVCVALLIVALVLAFVAFPDIIDMKIDQSVRLEEDTEQYDRFVELPFAIDFKIYLFHVENPEEILAGGRPNLTEKGPYVYRQYRKKTILNTDEENDEITYTQLQGFVFDFEASSPLSEYDTITSLNAPLMVMLQIAEPLYYITGVADHCIRRTFEKNFGQIFIKTTVKQLIFEGFNLCYDIKDDACAFINNIVCKQAATKRNIDVLPDNTLQFSLLNYKQKEHDGKYVIKRGMDDIEKLGFIQRWNDMEYTNYWGSNTTCSKVQGTDSTLYPPRIETDSLFYIYATDICRFVQINYVGEGTYKDIDGYIFGTDKQTLQPSTENREDDCYCSKLTKDADGQPNCYLDGLIDMQTCFGVPVLFSFPHFLWADEKYLKAVDGLSPNEDLHKIFLLVEPNTGTPLQGFKRIQLNAVVRPIFGVKDLVNATRVVLPLVWIEEGISLPDSYVDLLRSSYFDVLNVVEGVKWALIAITAVAVCVSGGFLVRKWLLNRKSTV